MAVNDSTGGSAQGQTEAVAFVDSGDWTSIKAIVDLMERRSPHLTVRVFPAHAAETPRSILELARRTTRPTFVVLTPFAGSRDFLRTLAEGSRELLAPEAPPITVLTLTTDSSATEELTSILEGDYRPLEVARPIPFDGDLDDTSREITERVNNIPHVESLYAELESAQNRNPFNKWRSEQYKTASEKASAFIPPPGKKYDPATSDKPVVFVGPRGSGKTLLLQSIQASVHASRSKALEVQGANVPEPFAEFFGIYCRMTRGAFATSDPRVLRVLGEPLVQGLATTEIILRVTQAALREVGTCSESGLLELSESERAILIDRISGLLGITVPDGLKPSIQAFDERYICTALSRVNDFVCRRSDPLDKSTYEGRYYTHDDLSSVVRIIRTSVTALRDCTLFLLLDEYESLLPQQKKSVNTLMKRSEAGSYVVKLGSRPTGLDTADTTEGEVIEERNDFALVDCHFDLNDPSASSEYQRFLASICTRILKNARMPETSVTSFFDDASGYSGSTWRGIESGQVKDMIARMSHTTLEAFDALPQTVQSQRITELALPAIYRVCFSNRRQVQFGGFDDLALLSSGIIRAFLELAAFSVHREMTVRGTERPTELRRVSIESQTQAVYELSAYYLDLAGRRADGNAVYQLMVDLGAILREKLLKHSSEPEAARIQILGLPLSSDAKQLVLVLSACERYSVLISPGSRAMRPRNAMHVQDEYNPLRLLAPTLGISPRLRWRSVFTIDELAGLVNPRRRSQTRQKLLRKVGLVKPRRSHRRPAAAGLSRDQRRLEEEEGGAGGGTPADSR